MNAHIVVTRHPALIDLLIERNLVEKDAIVIAHAEAKDVQGKDVIGVLPFHLAAVANSVTEIPLLLAAEDRGKELGIERLREVAGDPVTYVVKTVERSS